MYKLWIEGKKINEEHTFNSWDETMDYIDDHYSDNCDYWISVNGQPAMEVRDIWGANVSPLYAFISLTRVSAARERPTRAVSPTL